MSSDSQGLNPQRFAIFQQGMINKAATTVDGKKEIIVSMINAS